MVTGWKSVISDHGGELKRIAHWGKRNLAFDVNKFRQGNFILLHVQGGHEIVDELERQFKISDNVIRFQTVNMNPQQLEVSEKLLDRMENLGKEREEAEESAETAVEKPVAADAGETEKAAPSEPDSTDVPSAQDDAGKPE